MAHSTPDNISNKGDARTRGAPNAAQSHARAIGRPSTELNRARAQAAFLEEFAEGGIVLRAALKAGVGRRTVYLWLAEDPEFRRMYEEAIEDAMDLLESAARKRAEFGVERPVFQHGIEVGTVTDYSDNLLMFLLKGRRPDVFKERSEVDQRVHAELIDPRTSTDAELEARILAAADQIRLRHAKQITGTRD